MLLSCFVELIQFVILIFDVFVGVFEFVVYYMYGCNIYYSNEQSCVEKVFFVLCCCEVLRRKVSDLFGMDVKVQFFLELLIFFDRFMLDKFRFVCEIFLVILIGIIIVV